MALCPAGHQSQTTDYCDTCGAVMGGAAITPGSAAPQSAPSASAASGGASATGGSCPQCGAARGGRFCEECGFDFELAALVPPPVQAPTATAAQRTQELEQPDPLAQTAPMPAGYDFDAEFEKAEREFAAGSGSSAPAAAPNANAHGAANAPVTNAPATNGPPANPFTPKPPEAEATAINAASALSAAPAGNAAATPPQLAAVVTADAEYYAAQVARGDIVEDEFPFPKYPGERRFALEADRIRIGRASASRGIAVEIDLTGPPLDPAVSHLHAQLLRGADGAWSVVDLDSANGTRLNGGAEPLPAETEVPVKAGDRIHIGVWTTLALEEA